MERRRSIFDSEPEKRLFHSLASKWSGDYLVSDHVPVRNVIGWDQIKSLGLPDKDTRFLLSGEFDFVVCTKDEGKPLVAIEFDGYSRGFSKDGQFHSSLARDDRSHKFNTKLAACEHFAMPLVIVSYQESSGIKTDTLTVLDAIIGSVIAGHRTAEEVAAQMSELSNAYGADRSGELTGAILDEISFGNDLKYNPVVRRTMELRKSIGYTTDGIHFLNDRDDQGYVGGRFAIQCGLQMEGSKLRVREHYSFDLYLRAVNCEACDEANLLLEMGNYLLMVNAISRFGTADQFWRNAEPHGRWVER
jgi:hypothetical protein